MLRRTRQPEPRLAPTDLATAWQVLSLLLEYPSEELLARRPLLEQAVSGLPADVRDPVCRFLGYLGRESLAELQTEYVDTFDITKRCCLYLTWFSHGDTRKRGLALVQVKQAYRRAGAEFDADELPDHLAVILEFGASFDASTAARLLTEHRAGVEVLRIALAERGSPWHDVLLAVVATLPQLKGDDEEQLHALIAQGPPAEEVGLEPYAIDPALDAAFNPALDPRLNPRPSESVDLGPTIPVGAP